MPRPFLFIACTLFITNCYREQRRVILHSFVMIALQHRFSSKNIYLRI